MKKVVLIVDPGITGTGVVAWDYTDWVSKDCRWDFKTILIKSSYKQWDFAVKDIVATLKAWTKQMEISKLYIEFPQAFQSALGQAAINRGDIFKLVFLIGCIRGALLNSYFISVSPAEWKGQLPKVETQRRLKAILPQKHWVQSTHLWDAIGISLYLQAKF